MGADLAARVAQGEVLVLSRTKAALAEAGVSVEALEAAAEAGGHAAASSTVARSPTTLLVKNLPYSSTEDKLLVGCPFISPPPSLLLASKKQGPEKKACLESPPFLWGK